MPGFIECQIHAHEDGLIHHLYTTLSFLCMITSSVRPFLPDDEGGFRLALAERQSVHVQVSIARVYNHDLMRKKGLQKQGQTA